MILASWPSLPGSGWLDADEDFLECQRKRSTTKLKSRLFLGFHEVAEAPLRNFCVLGMK